MRTIELMDDNLNESDLQDKNVKDLLESWKNNQASKDEIFGLSKNINSSIDTNDLFYDFFSTEPNHQNNHRIKTDQIWNFDAHQVLPLDKQTVDSDKSLLYLVTKEPWFNTRFLISLTRKCGKKRQSESVPTSSDYFIDLKGIKEKNINWTFVSHVLRESDPHSSLTLKAFRKAYLSNEVISLGHVISKPHRSYCVGNSNKKSHFITPYAHKSKISTNLINFAPSLLDVQQSQTTISNFTPAVTPQKVYEIQVEMKKTAEENARLLEERSIILATSTSSCQGSVAQPLQITSSGQSSSQNSSYQQNLPGRLTTVQTSSLRPTMRLVSPRHAYDASRRNDPLKTGQLKDVTQQHHLRLSSNQSNISSTTPHYSNPILNASNINLYANTAGLVRSGTLNLTPAAQGSANARQIYVQNHRQTTPQLQAAQGLRQNTSTKILAGNSSIRTATISAQAQAARNCVSSMTSPQVHTIQRHHNRQVINAQKLLVTPTTSTSSNPYNPIVIPSQAHLQSNCTTNSIGLLSTNDINKAILRMSRRVGNNTSSTTTQNISRPTSVASTTTTPNLTPVLKRP